MTHFLDELVGKHKIQDGGTPLTARPNLNIIGATISDDPDNNATVIDLSGLGGGSTGQGIYVNYSGVLAIGDVVTSSLDDSDPTEVKLANAAALAAGGSASSVVVDLQVSPPKALIALHGAKLSTSVTGLSSDTASGVVVCTSAGRCERKAVASFRDEVVGSVDTAGVFHLNPLGKTRVGEHFANSADFGADGTDPTFDATPAIEAAMAYALTNEGDASYPTYNELFLPRGSHLITHPIRMTKKGFRVRGAGVESTVILPKFKGAAIIAAPDWSDFGDAAVRTGGPFSGNRFYPNSTAKHFFDLTEMESVADLNGLGTVTIEMWVRLETAVTGSSFVAIGQCAGLLNRYDDGAGHRHAWLLHVLGGGIYSTADNIVQGRLNVGGTEYLLNGTSNPLSLNVWTHIAIDYDGATIRLLVDGHVAATQVITGNVVQKLWEAAFLGGGYVGHNQGNVHPNFTGSIGPVRFSNVSNYSAAIGVGTTYTVPAAPFSTDVNVRGFADLFVCNWDQNILGDVYGGTYAATDQCWFRSQASTLSQAVTDFRIEDLKIYGNASVGSPGGIMVFDAVGTRVRRVQTVLLRYGLISRQNSYYGRHEKLRHQGSGRYPGIIDCTTAGDTFLDCQSEGGSWNWYLQGGVTMVGCTCAQWVLAGMFLNGAILANHGGFWDAEAQNNPAGQDRGLIEASNAYLFLRDGIISQGNIADFANFSLDACDGDIGGFQTSGGSQVTRQLDLPRDPPTRIVVRMFDTTNPTTVPMHTSRTAKVIVEHRETNGQTSVDVTSGDADLSPDAFTYRTIQFTGTPSLGPTITTPALSGWRRGFVNSTDKTITVAADDGGATVTIPPQGSIEALCVGAGGWINVGGEGGIWSTLPMSVNFATAPRITPSVSASDAIVYAKTSSNPLLGIEDQTDDLPTNELSISAQAADSAAATNVTGGQLSLHAGLGKSNTGTDDGTWEGGTPTGTKHVMRGYGVSAEQHTSELSRCDWAVWTSRDNGTHIHERIFPGQTFDDTPDQTIATIPLVGTKGDELVVSIRGLKGDGGASPESGRAIVTQLLSWDGAAWVEAGTADGDVSGAIGQTFSPKVEISGGDAIVKVSPWVDDTITWRVVIQNVVVV